MGMIDRIWASVSAMIKLEEKVQQQGERIKAQQLKIETLTERVIRLETTLSLLLQTREARRLE